jgi:hypothetical protein
MMGAAASITMLPGCAWLERLFGKGTEAKNLWKKKAQEFWTERVKKREAQRSVERREGKRPDVKTPYPYLTFDIGPTSHGYLMEQFRQIPLGQWADVYVAVKNKGNGASSTCYIELYEGPYVAYHVKYSDMRLVSRLMTSVLPGQKKEIVTRWQPLRATNGSVVVRCYDPVLDPAAPTYEQYFRQSGSFSWQQWFGG